MRRLVAAASCALLLAWMAPGAAGADEFTFSRSTNYESTLTFTGDLLGQPITLRAGSGTVSDECLINFGWMPRGVYDVQAHETALEGTIAGYAWQLSDQQCYDGTFRTNLLVHTEMAPGGGQDESWEPNAWTFDDPNDYASFGCIKVSYPDMLVLERAYEEAEQTGGTVRLTVR